MSLLEQPAVVSLVVGVKRIDQLEQLMQAIGESTQEHQGSQAR